MTCFKRAFVANERQEGTGTHWGQNGEVSYFPKFENTGNLGTRKASVSPKIDSAFLELQATRQGEEGAGGDGHPLTSCSHLQAVQQDLQRQ